MALEVVGAALPRTATMSLKAALEQLGFGPCHHMVEMFTHRETWPEWEKAFTGQDHDWDKAMPGFRACVDAPSCFVFDELFARNPEAKVIMSTRDPESWHRSVRATVGSAEHRGQIMRSDIAPLFEHMFAYAARTHPRLMEGFDSEDPEVAAAGFKAYQDHIRETVPADRLLVFRASDGWEPLCEFLGAPVPDTPYPRTNAKEDFLSMADSITSGAGGH